MEMNVIYCSIFTNAVRPEVFIDNLTCKYGVYKTNMVCTSQDLHAVEAGHNLCNVGFRESPDDKLDTELL